MGSTGVQRAKTRQQTEYELLENVRRAKKDFQQATLDNCVAARESYVQALDALNAFVRSDKMAENT